MAAAVGSRCECGGYYGTVKYIGTVQDSTGIWYGVEWDDVSRGKHSGVHNGHQYFTCSVENSGSFVRESKLKFGMTFRETLNKRYSFASSNEHFNELKVITFDGELISRCGQTDEIRTTLPNVQYLELRGTLLNDWSELFLIINELPQLSELRLSNIKMCPKISHELIEKYSFDNIKSISLIKMELVCSELILITKLMPTLKRLIAANNGITTLDSSFPHSLQYIDLTYNHISEWSQVLVLQTLPNLSTLIIGHNDITQLLPQLDKGGFPCLEKLFINDNNIQSWSSVNTLCGIGSLRELSITGNPFLNNETVFVNRQLIIARVPQLNVLQKSPINKLERVQAERDYINKYMSEWLKDKSSFEKDHPQYKRLTEVHGIKDILVPSSTSTALKNRLIAVTIQCNDQPLIHKKLPDSLTVMKLKGMIQRWCNIDSTQQLLSYTCREGGMLIQLTDDLKQLSYYSLQSGDIINVLKESF